jgi:demethylmenaquinone methyltransferase/2-methoxy-6-polyprenyl-1,4-benzoquinol methylase
MKAKQNPISNGRNPERNQFGAQAVTPQEKTKLVHNVFENVAENYDLMNDLMSMGVHRLWKNTLIKHIRPRAEWNYLDVAGGTGDIAFRIAEATDRQATITISDINPAMLEVGKDRALDRGLTHNLTWQVVNAEKLPFADNTFDVYTIAFGLRNVTHIDDALSEAYRVLKPGGRFFCLEFSHVAEFGLKQLYDAYSFAVIPQLGKMVANDRDSYQYLVESIRAFPKQADLCSRMQAAGFDRATYTDLSFGIAAIHEGWKI